MAEFIAFVPREKAGQAEQRLRSDFDVCAKQSITVRDAKALGINKEGSFFYITGSEEGVKKCKEFLKEFEAEAKPAEFEHAKKKIVEEQEKAAEGFGGIFG
ncbi:MAG: hypothetical protein V1887_02480 [Candidatus Aenigmatarchaeota archaeon]